MAKRHMIWAMSVFLLGGACHPLAVWYPKTSTKLVYPSNNQRLPLQKDVAIKIDELGVPHIYGETEEDLAYGLGFMHARDRLFHLDLIRHAALGRLTEIFGKRMLPVDRRLRIISLNVKQQYEDLSNRDKGLIESYAKGVNEGAKHTGRSSEMLMLGINFRPFTGVDAVAIGRLQAWRLAQGLDDELTRLVANSEIDPASPLRELLLQAMPVEETPIVRNDEHSGKEQKASATSTTAYFPYLKTPQNKHSDQNATAIQSSNDVFGLLESGASNSWIVHKSKTKEKYSILCNDPHLAHRAPSVFYLAHLEHPDFTIAGATFPGIPAVLIGVTRDFAWGMTASYTDVQDLVALKTDPADSSRYMVDGAALDLKSIFQSYKLGKSDKPRRVQEEWQISIFGPVLPEIFYDVPPPQKYALMWSGFDSSEEVSHVFSGFWDLGRATNLKEADQAIEKISFSGQNVALAQKDGSIAYRLAALAPLRGPESNGEVPADGSTKAAMWTGFLAYDERPRLDDPKRGYIVAANQRVVEDDGPGRRAVGRLAATTSRARRIDERIREILQAGKADANTLLEIQQDQVAISARELAPTLGALCPRNLPGYSSKMMAGFCDSIETFDGNYDISSHGALAYTLFLEKIHGLVFSDILKRHPHSRRLYPRYLNPLLAQELKKVKATGASPLFGENAEQFLQSAAQATLRTLYERIGSEPKQWQWGKLHTLTIKGPLSQASIIGGFWEIELGPQGGHSEAPRAEKGLPVTHGAAFRMVAHMSDPPRARMGIDTGNSGHAGHTHWKNQSQNWEDGTPPWMLLQAEEIKRATQMTIILKAPVRNQSK